MGKIATTESPHKIPIFRTSPFRPMKDIVDDVGRAFERFGDVIQVKGFPARVYCFRNPVHIEHIFYHQTVGGAKFPVILPRVKSVMRSGAYILEGGNEWKERRIPVQKGFKGEYLDRYLQYVPPLVDALIEQWEGTLSREQVVDVIPGLQSLITQVSFKQYFSIDLVGEDLELVRQQTHFIQLNFVKPWPLWLPFPGHLKFRRYAHELRQRFHAIVRARRANNIPAHDAMALLLGAGRKGTAPGWTDEQIVDEMFSIYFGAVVMATTLAWAIFLLGSYPEVQQRLRSEALKIHGGRQPRGSDLEQLPYSSMVLDETLRLYPPSWGLPRFTKERLSLDGYEIPAQSLVIPMIYHTHRHPEIWNSPLDYQPERFAGDSVEPPRPSLAFFPFGSGQRPCLGINLAPLIMRLTLSHIVGRLEFRFNQRFAGDPVADFGFEIHPADALLIRKAQQ